MKPKARRNVKTLRDPRLIDGEANAGQFEPLLESEEAAALLGIHPKTLQRMARNGELKGIRIGKLWRFRASSLNRWLENISYDEVARRQIGTILSH